MPRTKKFRDLVAPIQNDSHRREEVERHKEAIYEALRLGEIRSSRHLTQSDVAKQLGVSQTRISQLERRDNTENIYLSTLSKYITALGGELKLHAVFPDEIIAVKRPPDQHRAP